MAVRLPVQLALCSSDWLSACLYVVSSVSLALWMSTGVGLGFGPPRGGGGRSHRVTSLEVCHQPNRRVFPCGTVSPPSRLSCAARNRTAFLSFFSRRRKVQIFSTFQYVAHQVHTWPRPPIKSSKRRTLQLHHCKSNQARDGALRLHHCPPVLSPRQQSNQPTVGTMPDVDANVFPPPSSPRSTAKGRHFEP